MTDALATSVDRYRGVGPEPDAVARALGALRQRMLQLVRGFDDDQWQATSRCSEWTVHDVVRHMVDVAQMDIALQRGDGPRNAGGRIDPRRDPVEWLEASRGQTPPETVADFEATADAEQLLFEHRVGEAGDELLLGPYGPLHWSSLAAHLFWDAWLHERDIVLPLGLPHEGTVAENRLAALYGLAVASIAPTFLGSTLTLTIELTDGAPGYYEIEATPESTRVDFRGSSRASTMRARMGALLDALSGRGPEVVDVIDGPADSVEPLTMLRALLLPAG
jgi:uncharacterized protein (TIGR03083 family)